MVRVLPFSAGTTNMEQSGSCLICFLSITGAMMALKALTVALNGLAERIASSH